MTKTLMSNAITFGRWNWVSIATMTWFVNNIQQNLDFIKAILEKSHTHQKRGLPFNAKKSNSLSYYCTCFAVTVNIEIDGKTINRVVRDTIHFLLLQCLDYRPYKYATTSYQGWLGVTNACKVENIHKHRSSDHSCEQSPRKHLRNKSIFQLNVRR